MPGAPGRSLDRRLTTPGSRPALTLRDYLSSGASLPQIAEVRGITLPEIIAWHEHPDTQALLATLDRIAHAPLSAMLRPR